MPFDDHSIQSLLERFVCILNFDVLDSVDLVEARNLPLDDLDHVYSLGNGVAGGLHSDGVKLFKHVDGVAHIDSGGIVTLNSDLGVLDAACVFGDSRVLVQSTTHLEVLFLLLSCHIIIRPSSAITLMMSQEHCAQSHKTKQTEGQNPIEGSTSTPNEGAMLEEHPNGPVSISEDDKARFAVSIQRAFRKFALRRSTFSKVRHLNEIGKVEESALQIYDLRRKLSSQMDAEEAYAQPKINIKMIPVEAMIKIIGFFDKKQFFEFMTVCKHVHKVYRYNQLWNNFFTTFSPVIVDFVVKKNAVLDADFINLKSVVSHSIRETEQQLEEITVQLSAEKDAANAEYKQEHYLEAIKLYETALETASMMRKPLEANPFYLLKVPNIVRKKVPFLKLIAILNSNTAQSHMNLNQHLKAYVSCAAAMKHLNTIKQLLELTKYEEEFAEFEAKNKYRFDLSRKQLPFLFRFTRYSPDPVPELKVGSMLTASDDMGSGIFDKSKIIIYEHDGTVGLCITRGMQRSYHQQVLERFGWRDTQNRRAC